MDVCKPKSGVVLAMMVTESRIMSGAVSKIAPVYIRANSREYVTVKSVDGERIAKCGDWIVKLDDTSLLVLSNKAFKLMYDKF